MARRSRRKITARDLFRISVPGEPSLSPDGRRAVFAVRTPNAEKNAYRSHLYMVSTRGGRPVQLTHGDQEDSGPVFSPDGKRIAFVSNRGEKSNIWILPVAGGEARRLTSFEAGAVTGLVWSPDGRSIAFMRRDLPKVDPEKRKREATFKHITRIQYRLDGMGFYDGHYWHIWKVSVPGGRARALTSGDQHDMNPVWSRDGRHLLFVSNRIPDAELNLENSDIFCMTRQGRNLRQLTTHQGGAFAPAFSLDGRTVYFIGNFAKQGEWVRHPHYVFAMPFRGGGMRNLTPDHDEWLEGGAISDTANADACFVKPYLENGAERLAVVANRPAGSRIVTLPAQGGGMRLETPGKLSVLGASVNAATGEAVAAVTTIMDAGNLVSLRLDGGGELRSLTRLNRALLSGLDLTEPEETVFTNGRVKIHGWILRPPGFRKGRKYPMVLEIHGGPMAQYGYVFFHELHLLAAQGYVVAWSNPRGSCGYGIGFTKSIEGRWGTIDYQDVMAVADSMARRPYVDAKRMGVTGGSYGGFMTTWVVGHTNRFKAAVTQRQVGDFLSFFGSSDFGFYDYFRNRQLPWENPRYYLRKSPNYYAARIRTPLLIIHSDQDLRCPIGQAEQLFVFLKMQKKTTEFIRFEGEPHGLSRGGRPQNRRVRLERILDWFARYL